MNPGPRRVLVFGGSFNPVHLGHLAIAEAVREEFSYDEVRFVAVARSPFKAGDSGPGAGHRLAMLELACRDNPCFVVDDREIRRGGISYTIDTIRSMEADGTIEGKPGLLVGDDILPSFSMWREHEALIEEADIIVANRIASDLPPEIRCRRSGNRILSISSSDIRARLAAGLSIRYLVPEPVRTYISERSLYAAR